MSGPKNKSSLRKTVREVEDQLGVDKNIEDIVDNILSIFDDDEEESEEESSDSIFDSDTSDDSDSGDFGDGDFGGGGSSDDW